MSGVDQSAEDSPLTIPSSSPLHFSQFPYCLSKDDQLQTVYLCIYTVWYNCLAFTPQDADVPFLVLT